jgi:hypothetical protein
MAVRVRELSEVTRTSIYCHMCNFASQCDLTLTVTVISLQTVSNAKVDKNRYLLAVNAT